MRTFIAVDFPPEMLKIIEGIVIFFKNQISGKALKWVETDHLHLTLKFIGEIQANKVEQVKNILSSALVDQNAFEIEVSGVGVYPHKHDPRVLWLGITGGDPLIKIQKIINQALAVVDIEPERRPFTPHLTIARVRRPTDRAAAQIITETLSQYKVDPLGAVTIDQVHLYQSVLTSTGPIYTTLHSITLNQV